MAKEDLLPDLLELFRQQGYDGVSIAHISKATGLGKSSLYHHFPEGKEQMAIEVLRFIQSAVQSNFIEPLKGDGNPRQKLVDMAKVVEGFYDCGRKGCLVDGLTLGDANALFHGQIANIVETWIQAMADVASEAGVPKKQARERAENALVAIQGGLIVARALGNYQLFKRIAKAVPNLVLDGP